MVKYMKHLFINSMFNYISIRKELDEYNKVKIKYGLEVIYHFFTKAIVMLLLSLILGILKENLFIFIFYGIIRVFGHGIHAKTNLQCWIYSLITYVVLGFYIKNVYINSNVIISLCLVSILSYILFAPADTKNLPLINRKIRKKLKIKTVVVSLIFLLICLLSNNQFIKEVICISMTLEAILINPFLYKITNSGFNNYTSYNC